MFGSEFDSHRRLPEKPPSHDEEAEAAADPDPDTYSDDGYTPRDEPRSAKTKHGAQEGQRSPAAYCLLFTAGLLVFSLLAPRGFYTRGLSMRVPWRATTTTTHGSPAAPLNVFQVYPPVRVGAEYLPAPHERAGDECSVVLMQHEFAWSYGRPFVGSYAPPGCRWTHVLFNLTMTSRGRQFDRLGMLFLGDVEVFRTSTAEPTQAGIVFSYVKDMTAYTALLSQPQKLIFDLGNLVDSTYTGVFAATLTATFYTPPPLPGPSPFTYRLAPATAPVPAQHILPISVLASAANTPSHFVLPADNATTTHTLPRNTIHALVSLSASGNADEEFWYTNVPTAYTHTFPGAPPLPGASPFREIQLLVNGHLAGVAWPFPQIYTGGVNPALWRPIVGIAAYDVPEYTIDITPLLPALLGRPTTFEIRVVARDPAEQLPSNWIVSGRVFVWTDRDAAWTTTGTLHAAHLPHPAFTATTRLGAGNTTLYHRLTAQRALSRTATINTSAGPRPAAWTQGLAYESVNVLSGAGGSTQQLTQQTRGSSASAGEAGAATFSWPLALNTTFAVDDAGFTIWASVDRGVSSQGPGAAFPRGGAMHTRLNGSAVFVSGGRPGTWGATGQTMRWVGAPAHGQGVGGYGRVVAAEGGRVREDWEWVNGVGVPGVVRVPEEEEEEVVGGAFAEGWGVRRLLGRGPA